MLIYSRRRGMLCHFKSGMNIKYVGQPGAINFNNANILVKLLVVFVVNSKLRGITAMLRKSGHRPGVGSIDQRSIWVELRATVFIGHHGEIRDRARQDTSGCGDIRRSCRRRISPQQPQRPKFRHEIHREYKLSV